MFALHIRLLVYHLRIFGVYGNLVVLGKLLSVPSLPKSPILLRISPMAQIQSLLSTQCPFHLVCLNESQRFGSRL